jgi:hypothetical protein
MTGAERWQADTVGMIPVIQPNKCAFANAIVMNEPPNVPDLFSQLEDEVDAEADEKLEEKREEIRRKIDSYTLDTSESKVAYLLNRFPDTRESDISLLIRYWETFNSDKVSNGWVRLQDLYTLPRARTLVRQRARVQNTYKLFQASHEVRRYRGTLSDEEKEKAAKKRKVRQPAVTVYADESGKNQRNAIVGSIWVLTEGEFYNTVAAMRNWRNEHLPKQELHFKKISRPYLSRWYELVDQFLKENPILSFKAISCETTGVSEQDVFAELFYYIVRRGVEHEHETGRAELPRTLNFYKDKEEEGYDRLLLAEVRRRLEQDASTIFENELVIEEVGSLDSGVSPGIELADLFTGCVNRVLNPPAADDNYKDEFAKYFLEAVGMTGGPHEQEIVSDRTVLLSL